MSHARSSSSPAPSAVERAYSGGETYRFVQSRHSRSYRSGLLIGSTGTAAARIFSSPSTYRDDHAPCAVSRTILSSTRHRPGPIPPTASTRRQNQKPQSSRKMWPRFEEVVPYAEPRHGRGPEGRVPLNSGVGALGGKGNARCSRLQRTNHPAVPKQARGMAHRWRCCEERIPRMRYERLSRKRACLYLPNRRRFASVWRRAKARLPPQRSSGTKLVRLTTSGIVSVAPTRSFAKSRPQR